MKHEILSIQNTACTKNDFYTSYLSTESKIIYLFIADAVCA